MIKFEECKTYSFKFVRNNDWGELSQKSMLRIKIITLILQLR